MSISELSAERKLYLRALQREKHFVLCMRISILVFIIALWELAAAMGWIDDFIMSSPSRIFETLKNLFISGELFYHTGISCFETVIGFICGTVFGTLIAALLWWSSRLSNILDPYLIMLNSLPKTALGPIFIVWAGSGTGAIIAVTIAVSIIVTILEVYTGFKQTDEDLIRLMKTFGATKLQIFLKVVLPANYETIMNSLKVNVGLSWVGVIVGEFLVSKAGLGYLIVYGSAVFKMDLVMASVIILAISATLMYQFVLLAGKKILGKRIKV
ncbi:MAG: ABC transporter permease [Christensenellaceae bacterium]|nr:ABC transporter permease [Christensenellaceae bacterium]